MSIGLSEEIVSLNDATRLIPRRRRGALPHVSTLFRWSTHGVRGVVLETIQVGGTRCTSRQAIERFFAALTERSGSPATPSAPTPSRLREIEAAERRCTEAGA